MIQLHFNIKQLKMDETIRILQLFVWNYVKYANMKGFRRAGHILQHIAHMSIWVYLVLTTW